jgi:hypothetical protein
MAGSQDVKLTVATKAQVLAFLAMLAYEDEQAEKITKANTALEERSA